MDDGTKIAIMMLWLLFWMLLLIRAGPNRAFRRSLFWTRRHVRSRIRIFHARCRIVRGRCLQALGRLLLWLANRLEASLAKEKNTGPPSLGARLRGSALHAILYYFLIARWLVYKVFRPLDLVVVILVFCLMDQLIFLRKSRKRQHPLSTDLSREHPMPGSEREGSPIGAARSESDPEEER